jgi:drug/metabolite transporter (DMT)-like permease
LVELLSVNSMPTVTTVRSRWMACFVLVCVATIWGFSYLVIKDLLRTIPPATYLALRYAIALPVVAVLYRREIWRWAQAEFVDRQSSRMRHILFYLAPGLFLVLAFATQSYGIRESTPAVAAFLTSLLFCFIPLFELIAGERRKEMFVILPMICSLVGSALLTGVTSSTLTLSDVLLLLCAVGYAGQIYFSGKITRGSHFSIPFVTQGCVVLLAAAVGMLWLDGLPKLRLTLPDGCRLLFIALVATVVCYLLQFWAQQFVRSRYVGFIYTIEPVAALVLSLALGYEQVDLRILTGAAVILAGVTSAIWFASLDQPN